MTEKQGTEQSLRALNIVQTLRDYDRHVDGVKDGARLLAERLILRGNDGDEKLAFLLRISVATHDVSKLQGCEWPWIHQKEDTARLSLAILHHQQINSHHPEYWGGVDRMPPVAIAEMVCDWYARSQEMGTDLRKWVKEEAYKKYDIPPTGKVAKLTKEYIDLLLDPPFKDPATLQG